MIVNILVLSINMSLINPFPINCVVKSIEGILICFHILSLNLPRLQLLEGGHCYGDD